MKTATLPPIRVDPKVKKELESVLEPGETLSALILRSVVKTAAVRKAQRKFVALAEARSDEARKTGRTVPAEAVFRRMEQVLARAKKKAR